jgi:hypothetical protein
MLSINFTVTFYCFQLRFKIFVAAAISCMFLYIRINVLFLIHVDIFGSPTQSI